MITQARMHRLTNFATQTEMRAITADTNITLFFWRKSFLFFIFVTMTTKKKNRSIITALWTRDWSIFLYLRIMNGPWNHPPPLPRVSMPSEIPRRNYNGFDPCFEARTNLIPNLDAALASVQRGEYRSGKYYRTSQQFYRVFRNEDAPRSEARLSCEPSFAAPTIAR